MNRTTRRALQLALACGLLTGLGEGLGLHLSQRGGSSHWRVAFTSGAEQLWLAPLVDGLLFTIAGLLVVLVARLARRPPPLAALFGCCMGALACDWLRVTNQVPHRYAAGGGLLFGLLAWFAVRKHAEGVARWGRRGALLLVPVAALVAVAVEGGARWSEARAESRLPPPPAAARDVLIVVFDTVRSDHLSVYGYPRRTAPALERLAAEGVRFDSCFSTSSWTLPAHASMLTGRLPFEHGAALEPLDATWPLLSEELAGRGFRTGAFSGNLCFFQRTFGFGRGFLHFDDFGWSWKTRLAGTLCGREALSIAGNEVPDVVMRKPAPAVTDAFLSWLDRGSERPFFAFLNWFDAHTPYHPPHGFAGRFDGDGIAPLPPPPPSGPTGRFLEPAILAHDAQAYDESILGLDTEFARLTSELARRGRLERTIVIVVGDHGESFGENGSRFHRGSLQREQAQVPLIVRAPGLAPAQSVATGVASLASLPATVMDLLGFPIDPFPGPSLAPLWQEGAADDGEALLELARHPWPEYSRRPCFDGALRSIVKGRWHLLWHETRGVKLFDRVTDPREEHDVKEEHPDVASALGRELDREFGRLTRHPHEPMGQDLAAHPELAGIGYANDK